MGFIIYLNNVIFCTHHFSQCKCILCNQAWSSLEEQQTLVCCSSCTCCSHCLRYHLLHRLLCCYSTSSSFGQYYDNCTPCRDALPGLKSIHAHLIIHLTSLFIINLFLYICKVDRIGWSWINNQSKISL